MAPEKSKPVTPKAKPGTGKMSGARPKPKPGSMTIKEFREKAFGPKAKYAKGGAVRGMGAAKKGGSYSGCY